MPEVENGKQPDQEIKAYLAFNANSLPSLVGPIKPEDVAMEILDAISKGARNLVEVLSAYSKEGYKMALIQIYDMLVENKIQVRLLESLDSYTSVSGSSGPVVFMLSEDHVDLNRAETAKVMRKILSGDVSTLGNKGILVLGITQDNIDRILNLSPGKNIARRISDEEYTFPQSRAAGSGFLLFSLPLAAAAFGLFDATGYSEVYSPYIMGFWAATSFLAVLLLVVGFSHRNEVSEETSILSCLLLIAINLTVLVILGPSALEISVAQYGSYQASLLSGTQMFNTLLLNVALQIPGILLSLTIIYRLLPDNLKKFSLIALFCGLSSVIIEFIALGFYSRQLIIFGLSVPVSLAPQTYLSYFSYHAFIHPVLALSAMVFTLNFFKIYISIPVIGFAIVYNLLNFSLYARLGIGMLSKKEAEMP